jgi:hypothetical protein
MRKYLKEIEYSGVILMFIGSVIHRFFHLKAGVFAVGIGLLLWLIPLIYKAFHWQDFRRDNIQNIIMMLIAIALLFGLILFAR